jgi:protein SCO1
MNDTSRAFNWMAWGALVAVMAAIAAAYSWSRYDQAARSSGFPVIGQVESFSLTNQLAQQVTLDDLGDGLWVANLIFTRCPGPCALMTRQMSELQRLLHPQWPVKLISLTADPEHDQPDILQPYASLHQAEPGRWHFLTGEKGAVYELARKGLKLGVQENESEDVPLEEMFIHSTRFVLVDFQGRVRQTYEGTEQETPLKVMEGIKALLKEGRRL